MVCGQAHPQKTLPNTTVKKIMNIMKVRKPIAKMKKSCGQKIIPNKMNLRSRILNMKSGSTFTLINGKLKNKIR
jgi:hypothetical protein